MCREGKGTFMYFDIIILKYWLAQFNHLALKTLLAHNLVYPNYVQLFAFKQHRKRNDQQEFYLVWKGMVTFI